ncbi:hypothetical protein TL16_g09877 [Triparma laevis f. inornata]|uniref:Uncharacterized protein n=2 Tax=Triparma laevis TaxID=1534972 RepID=A0A9W6Z6X7_9STRA|nr:hypothetical protein TrLO_g5483 [Triparma laevis f. longispina]GMH84282.1 hypothetical protein TL16_g09877 [Triparma laevis f. inornata]
MEEFEDLVPQPDDDGRMELTYRAWTEVDDVVWTMGRTLVFLDVSFNAITSLPEELGDLYQLKELNIACNHITNLPVSIGKLIKLQQLKANGNNIEEIPEEIGKCKSVKVMHLNENKIIGIPNTLAECTRLEVLRLQNNKIIGLPHEIATLPIKEIDVSNNNELDMIPKPMRGNTDIVMWILHNHHANHKKLLLVEQSNMAMFKLLNESEEGIKEVKKETVHLTNKKTDLQVERSNLYAYFAFMQVVKLTGCVIM